MEKEKIFILGINSSSRGKRGMTEKLLKQVLSSAEKFGARTKIIHLANKKIKPCDGKCSDSLEKCKYPCPIKDDVQVIFKEILKADGIVFGVPAYWFNVPGQMKNLIDRMTCLENDGYLCEGKIAGFVAPEQVAGGLNAILSIAATLSHMGFVIPPYSMIFSRQEEVANKNGWVFWDTHLLGKNIVMLAKAQKQLGLSYDYPKEMYKDKRTKKYISQRAKV